jgi:hypothetical protein
MDLPHLIPPTAELLARAALAVHMTADAVEECRHASCLCRATVEHCRQERGGRLPRPGGICPRGRGGVLTAPSSSLDRSSRP